MTSLRDYMPNCRDGKGELCERRAEGWICTPDGRRVGAQCRRHAQEVITEYAAKLGQRWTFESVEAEE